MRKRNKTVYYAHSMRKYGTNEEAKERELLERHFIQVIDPSQLPPQRSGYEAMRACFQLIETSATALAFSSYKGHIGKGVYREIEVARACGYPIYEIRHGKVNRWKGRLEVVDRNDWSVKYAKARKAA